MSNAKERHVRPRIISHDHPSSWWKVMNESTGIIYYWNDVTNVTQYDRPSCLSPLTSDSMTCPKFGSDIRHSIDLGQVGEQVHKKIDQRSQESSSLRNCPQNLAQFFGTSSFRPHQHDPKLFPINQFMMPPTNTWFKENLPDKYCFNATNSCHGMPPQPSKLPPFLMANNQQDAMVALPLFKNVTPNIFKGRDADMWLRLHQYMCSTQTGRPKIPNSTLTECTGATNRLPAKDVKLASSTSGVPLTAGRSKDSMYISFRIPNGDRKWYHLDLAEEDKIVNENGSKHKLITPLLDESSGSKHQLITPLLDESSLDKHSYGAYTELNSSIYKMVHKYTPNYGGKCEVQVLATESLEGLSWKKFTPFSKYRIRPWVVSMGGKIYVVGAEDKGFNFMPQYEINDIEVLTHPESGKWESLPVRSPKILDWLEYFVVASEDYNKLIMGSCSEKCLLLYDVSTHQLERIDIYGYFPWDLNTLPVVVGKSLFTFSWFGISAYDLVERCFWLGEIDGLDNSFFRANCNEYETPTLVYLGGGKLCLICLRSQNEIESTVVHCCVFGVPEFREQGGERSLFARVDYIHKFYIGYTDQLLNVLLL